MADETVAAMVNAVIQAAIVRALNEAPDAVEKLVLASISKPVDEMGKPDGYGPKKPYLDYIVGEEIRRATRLAVGKIIQEQVPMIEEQVRKGLSAESVVAAVTRAFVKASDEAYRINVEFVAEKRG